MRPAADRMYLNISSRVLWPYTPGDAIAPPRLSISRLSRKRRRSSQPASCASHQQRVQAASQSCCRPCPMAPRAEDLSGTPSDLLLAMMNPSRVIATSQAYKVLVTLLRADPTSQACARRTRGHRLSSTRRRRWCPIPPTCRTPRPAVFRLRGPGLPPEPRSIMDDRRRRASSMSLLISTGLLDRVLLPASTGVAREDPYLPLLYSPVRGRRVAGLYMGTMQQFRSLLVVTSQMEMMFSDQIALSRRRCRTPCVLESRICPARR